MERQPPVVVLFGVGCIDSGPIPLGLYVNPLRNHQPPIHDAAIHLIHAAQYALGGFQQTGFGTFQPPLQTKLRLFGVALLRMSLNDSRQPSLRTTGTGHLIHLGVAKPLGVPPAEKWEYM